MILRFSALFVISLLVDMWYVQALGAVYLIYLAIKHFIPSRKQKKYLTPMKKNLRFWGPLLK